MSNAFPCHYYEGNRCRSCGLLPLGNRGAAEHKFETLRNEFKTLFPDSMLHPMVEAPAAEGSRSKVKVSVTGDVASPVIGILDESLSGIELLNCPLHHQSLNRILEHIARAITVHKLHPYQPSRRMGELKNIIMLSNRDASEVIVRFVLRSTDLMKRITALAKELTAAFPSITVVTANIQPAHAAILEGEEEIFLTENDHIWERYNGIDISFGPRSFMQVTPSVTEKLYAAASNIAEQIKPDLIVDLFCGSGGFLLSTAHHTKQGIGYELSEDAIINARRSAVNNRIKNVEFKVCNLLLEDLPFAECDLLIVNPPRRGLGASLLSQLQNGKSKYILYSSCNPSSFFEDSKLLSAHYHVREGTPFDMFPLTEHLELLCLLERQNEAA